ncbi:DMT family transporter [Leisingera aquimarina]|uniref:DMT family transporter n=1 Tax=Leisingera aquimarina TaxID=476529 RepID=UPI000489D716|nr:DMT family transporter [Leisingera aquimarina]
MHQGADNTIAGIGLLILGLFVFSIQDAIMKFFSDQMAVQEVIFARGVVTLALISTALYLTQGTRGFTTRRPFLNCLRGFFSFICFSTFSMALAVLPLADAMPLYYTAPLFVVIFAGPFLGETVGLRVWFAVVAGFIGVVLVAQPSADGVEPAMVLAIISAIAYSAQILLTRLLGSSESALSMTFYLTLMFVLFSGLTGLVFGSGWMDQFDHPSAAYLFRAWSVPNLFQAGLFLALGLTGTIGFYCISQAYRYGHASQMAPFEYSSLPFAVLWGWLFWGALPNVSTMLGSVLIVGGGLFIVYSEIRTSRKRATG